MEKSKHPRAASPLRPRCLRGVKRKRCRFLSAKIPPNSLVNSFLAFNFYVPPHPSLFSHLSLSIFSSSFTSPRSPIVFSTKSPPHEAIARHSPVFVFPTVRLRGLHQPAKTHQPTNTHIHCRRLLHEATELQPTSSSP
ncbi:hypothetical protein I3842_01G155500 [Carya illinoinensis]|uniref:Uncharacterized protein n=1 Tax=Carya illinoinensis TaxID=32201 RepID=A0A922FZG5_CARIL|nr:hypothetical protein I3842_01G155500 [Carya illinoinensis]